MSLESKQNINISAAPGLDELVIRHGEADRIHHPSGLTVSSATIDAVYEYLHKEGVEKEEIKNSIVSYSYEGLFLKLGYAFRSRTVDNVEGVLKLHPELEKWGINVCKNYNNYSLADFIKMNRHFFDDKATAMKLVSELRNIKVKAEKEFETSDNKRGDARLLLAQKVIDSNIPAEFTLNLPVFVGCGTVRVNVEVEIDANDFACTLISPDLKQIIDQETKAIIDEQLGKIRELYPQLRIFQK